MSEDLAEEDHAYCRSSFAVVAREAKACLAAKGITLRGIGAVSTKIGNRRHFTVEAKATDEKLVWQGTADCAADAKAKAVAEWCNLGAAGGGL
jgi:hypothetical protein